MTKDMLIRDVRYFESGWVNEDYADMPDHTGHLFKLPVSIHAIGARIARKLCEFQFHTGTFNHVYINFTTALTEGKLAFSPRTPDREDAWLRYVDYGANPKAINKLSIRKKEDFVTATTFKVLRFIAKGNRANLGAIDLVEKEVHKWGTEMAILHTTKNAKTYSVRVFYRIPPHPKPATGWVEYVDKESGKRRVGCFVSLKSYEDIFFLVSSIVIKDRTIKFMPRSSFKARLYNKRYKLPIMVEIDSLKTAREKRT
jgi:hypothetical protein